MENGWILLHRKIIDNPICKKPVWAWLWTVLLLLASHKEKDDFIWNGKPIKLKKGQFITGRKRLKEITGIAESTIEDILKYLESQQQIQQQKTTKFRLITILKWDTYQKRDIKSDNRATTEQQQSDTINKGNKDNNDKELTHISAEPKVENQLFDIFYKTVNPNINYGNRGQRQAAEWLVNKWGIEKVLNAAKYAISVQNDKFAPTINTPYQLKEKMADLIKYQKSNNQPKGIRL